MLQIDPVADLVMLDVGGDHPRGYALGAADYLARKIKRALEKDGWQVGVAES